MVVVGGVVSTDMAERTRSPGAVISGLSRPSRVGPQLLKLEIAAGRQSVSVVGKPEGSAQSRFEQ